MALDATAREANIRDSIKKFFVDSLETTESIALTYDKALSTPKVQGIAVNRWVTILIGPMELEAMSTLVLNIYVCTKQDSEGFKLAQLRDTVMGYLSDTEQTDGMKRIPLYRSRASGNWTQLDGGFVVQEVTESGQMDAPDETKFKILSCTLRWSAKI